MRGSADCDVEGAEVRIEASGLEARVLQHEIDHLDGVLILDRAPRGSSARAPCAPCARAAATARRWPSEDEAGEDGEHREPRTDA